MEITHEALEAIRDEVWDEGYQKGKEEAEFEHKLALAQFRRLREILEVEGDQSLLEAADLLFQEASSHREAARAGANILEQRRKELVELRAKLAEDERQGMAMQLFHDKTVAAMNVHICQLEGDLNPKAEKIKQLNMEIVRLRMTIEELRGSLLKHLVVMKESA